MIAGVGALVRRERLARDWSLKGLAHGICAVSYLSKIERGEADPSPEVTGALLERLGIAWHDDEAFLARARDVLDRGYDALLSFDEAAFPALRDELADLAADLACLQALCEDFARAHPELPLRVFAFAL